MKMIKIMLLCRWVRARLLLYFGGETSVDDSHVIKDHLMQCSHCNKYSRKLNSINNLVAECMRKDKIVPLTLAVNVMNKIRSDQSAKH
jgi:predicted anti-sigma-YlaC factor YlaD